MIKKRIVKAAKYIPLDRLYLSPQCGFASCEIGNKLTEEEQWAKLALVKEIAKRSVGVRKNILLFIKKTIPYPARIKIETSTMDVSMPNTWPLAFFH